MADNSLITQEQYNEDMKRLYDEKIYPYLNGSTHTGCVPLGTILPYFGETAPTHFLICDGTAYNKNDYPELSAHLLALTDPSPYVVSGDDTKFKVPDLRGEFLRGTGTNGHSGEGSGSTVGVHQDGTELYRFYSDDNKLYFPSIVQSEIASKYDSIQNHSGETYRQASGTSAGWSTAAMTVTSRPTNTSVTYIIAYRNAYIDLALDSFPIDITNPTDGQLLMWDATAGRWVNGGHKYSTEEHVVGKWIDSKPIYERTFNYDNNPPYTTNTVLISNVDKMIVATGDLMWKNGASFSFPAIIGNDEYRAVCDSSTHTIKLIIVGSYAVSGNILKASLTFQYTKTTDTPSS